MKTKIFALMFVLVLFVALGAVAAVPPYGWVDPNGGKMYATAQEVLVLNEGPGTNRYFAPLGSKVPAGTRVPVLARAWDPNNGIWWVKVEWPEGTGITGWTGRKRFYDSSYNFSALPIEQYYPY